MTVWNDRPLADVAAALRNGEVTALALAETAIARHDDRDSTLGAYKSWDPDFTRAQARAADAAIAAGADPGPLLGIPLSVKDIYGVQGYPTFAGSARQLPPEYETEGPLVRRTRDQLAVITGKTNTVEFAYGGLGTNAHWGTPRNPWDGENHRVSGGSSAGAGVSLWEGSALLAFGTDTGGSVRVPASMTGTAGLKTTAGRWPTAGIVPLSSWLDTPGILTRTVRDLAFGFIALDRETDAKSVADFAVHGLDALRLGVTSDYFWERCQDDIARVCEQAIAEISGEAAKTVSLALPEAEDAAKSLLRGAIVASEGYASLHHDLPDWLDILDPNVGGRMADGKNAPAHEYIAARRHIEKLRAIVDTKLRSVDLLAVPTVPITPPSVEAVAETADYRRHNLLSLSNTTVVNILGLAAIALPVGLDKAGMPVGIQLIGRAGSEEILFCFALAAEKLLGTARERLGRPPLAGME